jgi:hypothetical protein
MGNKESLDKIISEVFQLSSPKIKEERRDQVRDFIETTINGDETKKYLVINAGLAKDRLGVLVYVLTNVRLIKIEIDTEQEIKSSSFPLDTIIGVERKLIDGDKAAVEVAFQNGSMGLKYSAKNQTITNFFQEVDQSRAKGIRNG